MAGLGLCMMTARFEFPRSPPSDASPALIEAYQSWRSSAQFLSRPPSECPACHAPIVLNHIDRAGQSIFTCQNAECPWPFNVYDPAHYSGRSDPQLYLKWSELHLQHVPRNPNPASAAKPVATSKSLSDTVSKTTPTPSPAPSDLEIGARPGPDLGSKPSSSRITEIPLPLDSRSASQKPPQHVKSGVVDDGTQSEETINNCRSGPAKDEPNSSIDVNESGPRQPPSKLASIFDDLDLSEDDDGVAAAPADVHSGSNPNPVRPVSDNSIPAPSPARSLLSEEDFGFMSPFSGQSSPWSPRGGVPPSPRTSETDSEFRCPIPKYLRTVSQMHLPQMLSPLPLTPLRRDDYGMSDSESDTAALTPRVDRMNDFRLSAASTSPHRTLSPQRKSSPNEVIRPDLGASASGSAPSDVEIFKSPPARVDSPVRAQSQGSPAGLSPMKMVLKKDGSNDSWQINPNENSSLPLALPDLDQKPVTDVDDDDDDGQTHKSTPPALEPETPIAEKMSSPVSPIKSYSKKKSAKASPDNQVLGSLSNRLSMNVGVPISIVLPNSTHDLPPPSEKENQESSAIYISNLSKRLNLTPDDFDREFKHLVKGLGQDPVSLDFIQKVQKSFKAHQGHASDRSAPKLVFHVGDGKAAIDLPQDTMDVSVNAQKDNVSMYLCSNSDGVEGQALKVAIAPGTLTTPERYRPKRGRPKKVVPEVPGPTRFPCPEEILNQSHQIQVGENDGLPYYGPEFQAFLNDPEQVAQFKHHIQLLMQDFPLDQAWLQSGVDPVVAMLICRACSNMGGPIDFLAVLNWYGKLTNYETSKSQQPTDSNPSPSTPSISTPPSSRKVIAHVSPMSSPPGANSPKPPTTSPVIKTEIIDLPSPSIGSNKSVIPGSVRPGPRSVIEVAGQAPATSSGLVGKGKYKMTCTVNNSLIGPICVETEAEMKAVMAIIRDNSAKSAHRGQALIKSPQYFSDAASARSLLSTEITAYLDKAFTQKGLSENVIGKKKKNYPKRSQVIKIDPKTGEKIYPQGANKTEILKIKQEFDEAQATKKLEAERKRKSDLIQESELKAKRKEEKNSTEAHFEAAATILSISSVDSTQAASFAPRTSASKLSPIKPFAVKSVPVPFSPAKPPTSVPLTTSNLLNLSPTRNLPTPQKPQYMIHTLEPPPPQVVSGPTSESAITPANSNSAPVLTKRPALPQMQPQPPNKGRRKYGGYKAKKPAPKVREPVSDEKSQSIAAKILELPLSRLFAEDNISSKGYHDKNQSRS
ncbi:hypothetical protein TCAL_16143 [Tigriopus californicus]|uniref:Uncharacterized protein n=1 Tax=Tigriopus californicus TaxID=6832 RepID=A0A553P1W8_TIGCA|nr:hypothetical protein TCAL_16143 [Tigriopus californicus]